MKTELRKQAPSKNEIKGKGRTSHTSLTLMEQLAVNVVARISQIQKFCLKQSSLISTALLVMRKRNRFLSKLSIRIMDTSQLRTPCMKFN